MIMPAHDKCFKTYSTLFTWYFRPKLNWGDIWEISYHVIPKPNIYVIVRIIKREKEENLFALLKNIHYIKIYVESSLLWLSVSNTTFYSLYLPITSFSFHVQSGKQCASQTESILAALGPIEQWNQQENLGNHPTNGEGDGGKIGSRQERCDNVLDRSVVVYVVFR